MLPVILKAIAWQRTAQADHFQVVHQVTLVGRHGGDHLGWRRNFTRRIRHNYSKVLVRVLRHPWLTLFGVTLSVVFAVVLLASDVIKVNFFASDPYRVVYVSAELPTNKTAARLILCNTYWMPRWRQPMASRLL